MKKLTDENITMQELTKLKTEGHRLPPLDPEEFASVYATAMKRLETELSSNVNPAETLLADVNATLQRIASVFINHYGTKRPLSGMSAKTRCVAMAALLKDQALKPWVIESENKKAYGIPKDVLTIAASTQLQPNCKFDPDHFIRQLKTPQRPWRTLSYI